MPANRYIEAIASLKPDQGWIIPSPIADRAFRKRNLGPYRTRGTIGDFPVEPENIGELLYGAFGNVLTTNPASGVYLHTFSPADSLPSYTFHIGSEQKERLVRGSLVEALTIKFAHDDDLKARAEILSGWVESSQNLETVAFSTLQALNMLTATNILTIDGISKKYEIYDLEITIKNNIPFDRGNLGSRQFTIKRYGAREVTGKLSAYFDNTEEYDRFIAGNEFTLIIHVDGPVITGAYKYYLEFELRKCIYLRDVAPDIAAINEPLVVDAPFKAFYDTYGGFNAEAKAKLQNAISAY